MCDNGPVVVTPTLTLLIEMLSLASDALSFRIITPVASNSHVMIWITFWTQKVTAIIQFAGIILVLDGPDIFQWSIRVFGGTNPHSWLGFGVRLKQTGCNPRGAAVVRVSVTATVLPSTVSNPSGLEYYPQQWQVPLSGVWAIRADGNTIRNSAGSAWANHEQSERIKK
jgi:hypothetical protein